MAIETLDDLRSEIADHLDRGDLNGRVDTFIRLAESRHERDIRIREMVSIEELTVDSRRVALPDDFLEGTGIRLLTSPPVALSELSYYEMTLHRQEHARRPTYFTITDQIEFDSEPDSAYTAELLYHARIPRLTDDNPTNVLLSRYPDAYLYAALSATAPFLMNDERLQVWGALYQEAVQGINRLSRRRSSPLVARVAGATP